MASFLDLLDQPLLQRLGWTLVHSVWQGIAVAILLARQPVHGSRPGLNTGGSEGEDGKGGQIDLSRHRAVVAEIAAATVGSALRSRSDSPRGSRAWMISLPLRSST